MLLDSSELLPGFDHFLPGNPAGFPSPAAGALPAPAATPPPAAEPVRRTQTLFPANGKSLKENDEDQAAAGVTVVYAERRFTDAEGNGGIDNEKAEAEAGMVRMRNSGNGNLLGNNYGGTHGLDLFYTRASTEIRATDRGSSSTSATEIGAGKWSLGASTGPAEAGGRYPSPVLNPTLGASLEVSLARAKAEYKALAGWDGERVGVQLVGEGGAAALQAEGNVVTTSPTLLGYNIQLKGKAGASVASAGAGAGAWGFFDTAKNRLHIGAMGKLAIFVGLEGEVELSAGQAFVPEKPAAPGPGGSSPAALLPSSNPDLPGFGDNGIPGSILNGSTSPDFPPASEVPSAPGMKAGGVRGVIPTGNPTVLIGG